MKRLLLLSALLLMSNFLTAQGWGQIQKIVPDDRFLGQKFGRSVAIDGNYAVVGMENNSTNDMAGAYVFKNDGSGNWIQIQKLGNPNYNQFDSPGQKVAIHGDYIFVGDRGEDYDENEMSFFQGAGAVYVFKNNGSDDWVYHQKLVASDRAPGMFSSDHYGNQFGSSIAIDGNYAAIGVIRQDLDASGANELNNAGAVYVFELDGNGFWNETQKIVASDRGTSDYFGRYSVAIDGNVLVAGANFEDEDVTGNNTLSSAGSAYIFERDSNGVWNETQKLVASDREQGEWFGKSVSISGDIILVGAEQEYITGNANKAYGAVYIFEKGVNGVWNEAQKITPSYSEHQSKFGQSVSIDGDHIIVGAYRVDIGSPNTGGDGGAAFMFEKDATGFWNETAVMYDINTGGEDYFGIDVAVSGDNAIVGAFREEEDETDMNALGDAGSAYIFNINEPNNLPPLNTLSILENTFETNIRAYPNPFNTQLNINLGNNFETVSVTIHNFLGQKVFSKVYNGKKTIQLELNQPKGMYMLNVKRNGEATSFIKVIKE